MQFRNYTPFIPLAFESRDEKKNDFGVLVLRGSFDINHAQVMRLSEEQEPIVMADEFVDQPATSSITVENSIAPFKTKTDIHIKANAYSPEGELKPEWLVRAQIGEVDKILHITGPRYWEKTLTKGWKLSEPLPINKLPIQYEYAFGGTNQVENEETPAFCKPNPIGTGFVEGLPLKSLKTVAAPQIVSPDKPDLVMGESYIPEGFGPIAPAWSPRIEKAGTFDAVWQKSRWPDLPEDFSFDFYNSAHPDLIYPGFVEGGEEVKFYNLTPDGYLSAKLPQFELAMLVRYQDGEMRPLPMFLDTLHFDIEKKKAYATWRGIYGIDKDIRVLEARMRDLADVSGTNTVSEPEFDTVEMKPLQKPRQTAETKPLGDTQVQKPIDPEDQGLTQAMAPLSKREEE